MAIDGSLLRNGVETTAKVISTRPTGVSINEEPQYEVILSYKDHQGVAQETSFKTLHLDELTDEAEETLLYDPREPSKALPVDGLPDSVRLKKNGELTASLSPALVAAMLGIIGTFLVAIFGTAITVLLILL